MTTIAEPMFVRTEAAAAAVACTHCAQPVPAGLVEAGAERQFCCPGCRAVYETLHACGLDGYYQLREAARASGRPVKGEGASFESFDAPKFHELYVRTGEDGTSTVDLALEGVTCAACVWLLERLPRVLEGVVEARLSLRDRVVRVTWDAGRLPLSAVARTMAGFGYVPHPARGCSARELHRRESRRRLTHLAVAGALMGNSMLLAFALYAGDLGHMGGEFRALFRWLSAGLGVLALAWPGAGFFRSAWAAVRTRTVNLDVPIAMALAVGGVAGMVNVVLGRGEIYFDSLTVLIFLLLVGRFIQYRQQRQADDAVGLLFSLTPSSCRVVRDGGVVTDAPVEALAAGDVVEVRAGDLFPADGVVVSGRSAANEALLTGESMPVEVGEGSAVHAGSQNTGSVLRVRVTEVGPGTRVGKLMHLVERGVQERPAIQLFADRVGRWFTVGVSVAAAGVFAYWARAGGVAAAVDHSIAFLIVTCPCVLGLATPMTLALAIGQLARRDILVKSGVALEAMSRGGRMLLDKTGTLTEGRMALMEWVGDQDVRPVVAELERRSGHPVGRALFAALTDGRTADVGAVTELGDGGVSTRAGAGTVRAGSPGYMERHGVEVPAWLAEAVAGFERDGATAVLVAVDGAAVAAAALGDRARPDSARAVRRLRGMGWGATILSGDAREVVGCVARELGFGEGEALGALSPEEKLGFVRSRRDAGERVVMVGDGVNDAAALAAADVGVAVHGGAEASLAAADVYVARPGVGPLVDLVETSRRTMRTIRRSFAVALAYNALAGGLAAAGAMTPLVAAVIMPVSSATVLSLAAVSARRGGRKGATSWK